MFLVVPFIGVFATTSRTGLLVPADGPLPRDVDSDADGSAEERISTATSFGRPPMPVHSDASRAVTAWPVASVRCSR